MDGMQNNFCLILRNNLSAACKHNIGKMSAEEWAYICEIASDNNLLPLLYYSLKGHKISMPQPIENSLRNEYLGYSGKDLKRGNQLRQLIKLFNEHGIDHILLKGSHLAEKVYPNSALRMMCDIDICVKNEDIENAFKLLLDAGYYDGSGHSKSNIVKDVYVHHYPVLLKDNLFPVELHRYLFETNDLENINLIWRRAQEVKIDGMPSKVMAIEDLLIYTALHGLKYHTHKLGVNFLYDLKVIIDLETVDWKVVSRLVKDNDWGNSKTLYSALVMVKQYFHAEIPADFLSGIRPEGFSQRIQTSIEELILYRQIHNQIEAYTFSFHLFHALRKMSVKHIFRQLLFSPEKISSEVRSKHKDWRIATLYFQSDMLVFAAFMKILYQYFITGNNGIKKAVNAGRQAGVLTHWLES